MDVGENGAGGSPALSIAPYLHISLALPIQTDSLWRDYTSLSYPYRKRDERNFFSNFRQKDIILGRKVLYISVKAQK
jgi:hypothetical protein